MKFEVVIDYSVDSTETVVPLEKEIKYEYYKYVKDKKEKIYYDTIYFKDNKIVIEGKRNNAINIENCWRSKKSNFKRCVLSSLFYIYNYYKKPIDIISIKISHLNKKVDIPFIQEFKLSLPNDFSIDLTKIEYIFKKISFPELSEVLYRVLHTQALFLKNKDFYSSYRSFNSMYTFYYSYHDDFFKTDNKKNNKADKLAIISLLKLNNLESNCQKSVSLAEDYFKNSFHEIYNLIYILLIDEKKSEDQFREVIGDEYFKYENYNVLNLIRMLVGNYYKINLPCRKVIEDFTKRWNLKSDDNKINYLQFLTLYALYRRNKLLHGEHVDSTFLIPDVNADILFELSEIIFQFSIDLVNSIAVKDFTISKIMQNISKRYL